MQNQGINSFFSGSVWELKKVIGSLSILRGKKYGYFDIDIDMDSYIKLINTPLVTATLENQYLIRRNTNHLLKRMDLNSKKIIEILYELNK